MLIFQLNSHGTKTAPLLPHSLNAELNAKSESASAREGRARALEIVSKLTTENQSLIKAGGGGAVYNKLLKKSPPNAARGIQEGLYFTFAHPPLLFIAKNIHSSGEGPSDSPRGPRMG